MTATPRPVQSGIPVDLYDRTLWMLLRALVAHRPAAIKAIDAEGRRVTRTEIASTVREVEKFAEKVSALFLVADVPVGLGSARAVATAVVQLCTFLVHGWSHHGALTDRRVAEFNREVEVLEACLDGIASRFEDGPL